MTKLSVNINKIATIRNARGGNTPNLIQIAIDCQRFGADGITVHPRPDERHIRYSDVYDLKKIVNTEFNIEGYPSEKFMELVKNIKPEQVTLVPDPPDSLTSSAGWDTINHKSFLKEVIYELQSVGIRTSIFIDTNLKNIENAVDTETDRIELYTEPYATMYPVNKEKAVENFILASKLAKECNLDLNAGHDLSLDNLNYFYKNIENLKEVSIGHALISDALYFGLENTIQMYLRQLK
ncbi:MAG: pyridoxine 5'-phosphate synthase [Bacteroidetes bacterium GWA2_31_9]|nr:MAG: pyridoxine 5'-phosphate synthase [Bacteroidetes bacterium GWA2_31_9]